MLFRSGTAASVRLVIVDAAGRRIRGLIEGETPAGLHTAAWDGLDDARRAAPAGVYFAVLDGLESRDVTRLVRLSR